MIINGRRVSREALVGDPGFFGAGGIGRFPSRPVVPSRNSVTAVGAVSAPAGRELMAAKRGHSFFGRLFGGLGALGGLAIGGPAGAALALGPALSRRLPTPGGVGFPGFPGLTAGLRGLAGGAGRMTKKGGFTMRRRPRMRVTNTRPLLRALRRVRGFERIARGVITISHRFRRRPHIRRRRRFGARRAA